MGSPEGVCDALNSFNMEKSSIHFENVKPTSQSHNLRQRTFDYVRKELTPLNKSYGNMKPHSEVIEELKKIIAETNVDMVIFNDELSPYQIRNLEEFLDIEVIDRTQLILDIFYKFRLTNHYNKNLFLFYFLNLNQ